MLLLNGESLSKSFGTRQLFSKLSLSIFSGDRIGLIGPNGSGKSTLLKMIAGLETADEGLLSPRRGLKIGYVPQTCDFPDQKPIDILIAAQTGDLPDYEKERLAETWLSKLDFTGQEPSAALLSGGWKKRLMIAKQMIGEPDLLLLDEPTNHLDIEGILWLEKFLKREAPTYLLVSHDRYFLQHAANRIIEIAPMYPQGLLAIDGSYSNFLEKKEEFLEGQLQQERSMASKARREVDWLRSGVKARTTKSQARIDQAHELLDDLADVKKRNKQLKAALSFESSERETHKLLAAKNLTKSLGGKPLFKDLDFILSPGTRIGLMGPNGSGKTTLLRVLADEVPLDMGTIKRADTLKTVYFDQHRNQLPDSVTLRQALAPAGEYVYFRGQPIHVNGWCKRFLFTPDILDMPIGKLSGGERARIAIAHLMLQPADLLLLDEPTNDLDIPTLEILEENLLDFQGAVVLITHDRCMLERICNQFLAIGETEFFASYGQWEDSQKKQVPVPLKTKDSPSISPKSKMSYLEKKELEQIDSEIQKAEESLKTLTKQLENPVIASNEPELNKICTAIGIAEGKIEKLYLRWEELDRKQRGNAIEK